MSKKNKLYAIKTLIYIGVVILLFVLETTPAFLRFAGIKPRLLLSFSVVLAMFEAELAGGLFGALCGLCYDYMGYTFYGFFSVQLMVICTAVGLAFIYLVKNTKAAAMAVIAGVLLYFSLCEYYLFFGIWRLEGAFGLFTRKLLPQVLYSLPFALLFYLLVARIHHHFAEQMGE